MIATITDTHCGARSSSSIFRDYMKWWYETYFFPTLKTKDVETILHLGDFFDNRNSISLSDIDFVVNWFAKKLVEGNHKFIITLGNHDVAFKNTNKIHSLTMLKAAAPDNVIVIDEPVLMTLDGQRYALIPWINSSNYDSTMEFLAGISDKASTIVAGHFEIAGAKMYANSSVCEHGLNAELFNEFKELWSGHFHHKSKMGNIKYLGSPFHLNWQDYDDERGFHLFDSSTGNLEYVENETCLFRQVAFDEAIFKAMKDDEYKELFEGMFVRLVIDDEYSKVVLMDTISKINRVKPHDLQVINNHIVKKDDAKDDSADTEDRTSKTTDEYILTYIEEREEYNTDSIKNMMADLYKRAQDQMVEGE
jgi:DNA repair exonuclease SbcCD nuclease subunit